MCEEHTKGLQSTLLMVMPEAINLNAVNLATLDAHQKQRQSQASGIGYARLCIQLTAHMLGLPSIWMLDDNISDCWQLLFNSFVSSQGQQHGQLTPVRFEEVMKSIEKQVLTVLRSSAPLSPAINLTCLTHMWVATSTLNLVISVTLLT